MPAEWEPHAATWVAWPARPLDWSDCLAQAEEEFVGLVRALAASEPTRVLLARDAPMRAHLEKLENVEVFALQTHEAYLRDTGPTFVVDGSGALAALDWMFDAWGGRFPDSLDDDRVASAVAGLAGAPVRRTGLACEGGAIDVDGAGTLLASASVATRRNPALGRGALEDAFGELLGISRVVWIDEGLPGDDTDGHVDTLARFVAPGRVACAHPGLAERLCADLEVVELPVAPAIEARGRPLPASYANFFVANRAVLVPQLGVATDTEALETLGALFPGRPAVGIASRVLLRGGGSVHCLTQQQPRSAPR